jgi:hypothetical protein
MEENYDMLKVYCDKQKIMIADLLSKVLMLETKLEVIQAQMRNSHDSDFINKQQEEPEEDKPSKPKSLRAERKSSSPFK